MIDKNRRPEISNAEFEVLDVIWDSFPASASEIIARLEKKKEWHDKTVKTLLSRLVKKEVLGFEKQQRQYLYFPLIEREDYRQSEASHFVGRLFNGKVAPLVTGFASQNALSKQDIDELKALISDWEQDND